MSTLRARRWRRRFIGRLQRVGFALGALAVALTIYGLGGALLYVAVAEVLR